MPTIRKIPLVNGETYHIFNRGIDRRVTFGDSNEFLRAYESMKFYQSESPPMRISQFLRIGPDFKQKALSMPKGDNLVTIYSYCFMPNHFHFVLRQELDNGVSRFVGRFLNSYTRYYNTKHKRVGGLFLDQFKNVLVQGDTQLLHLSRYVHLNPYSSGIVKNLEDLSDYKWSSLKEYLGKTDVSVCDKKMIMSNFKNRDMYKKFVFDRAEYQRELKELEM